jgi:CHRD domain
MRKFWFGILITGLCALGLSAMRVVRADDDPLKFAAKLDGFQEVGALNAETGAILSGGKGTLKISLDRMAKTFSFELTYSGLSAPVTQSHIHFGRVHTPGGIMVFFCTNLGNGPAGTQACPANGGTVTGTVSAGNVVGPAAQHVTAGDFDAVIEALLANAVYANVHTTIFPAGEIRGQVLPDRRREDRRWRPGPFGGR